MNLLQKLLACLCVLNLAVSKSWWQTGVIYQIYPRSFQDSNGDGVGDLKGITQRLDYLKDIGVSAIWLSPIYKSPMADFGYDISNFREIDPIFGTMDDFKELKRKCSERGIKLVLDFVPNHSSDDNEWFTKSVAKEKNYENYYVWKDGVVNNATNTTEPPNNWISVFGGPAWTWNEDRKQYYLHQFLDKQPDLNYRDPNLVQEMRNVLTFWMDLGVDGFRVDAIPYLFEKDTFEDEPRSEDSNAMPNETSYLSHMYTQNQPETYDMVQQWRQLMDEQGAKDKQDRVMMVEAYASFEQVMQYYGTNRRPGAHFPFNFLLITDLNNNSNSAAFEVAIFMYLMKMPTGYQPNWVLGNHDNSRVASRFGPELVDGLNMLALLLPGTAITYYGEEIGMVDTDIPPEEIVDVSGRDPERTPMQWDNTTNAGFSDSKTTWLRVNENYPEINVERQLSTERSHLSVYKRLVELRQSEIIQSGRVAPSFSAKSVFSFQRYLSSSNTSYVVYINLNDTQSEAPEWQEGNYTVYVASVNSARKPGDNITFPLILEPKEALVVEVVSLDTIEPSTTTTTTTTTTSETTTLSPEITTKGAGGISAGILLTLVTSLAALLFNH